MLIAARASKVHQLALASLARGVKRLSSSWAGSDRPPWFAEADLEEEFVKGGGPGGQGVNKSANAVSLHHLPTKARVRSHKHRALSDNRKEARRILELRLDALLHGELSKQGRKLAKARKSKASAARRARLKYARTPAPPSEEGERAQPEKRQSRADKAKQQLQHLLDS